MSYLSDSSLSVYLYAEVFRARDTAGHQSGSRSRHYCVQCPMCKDLDLDLNAPLPLSSIISFTFWSKVKRNAWRHIRSYMQQSFNFNCIINLSLIYHYASINWHRFALSAMVCPFKSCYLQHFYERYTSKHPKIF